MPARDHATGSSGSRDSASEYLARWPGLISLSLGVLLGPVAALVNHGLIYVATPWACGHGGQAALHVIPAVCFILALGGGLLARADWRRAGPEAEAPAATVRDRSRFLALCGLATSALSALLILTHWLAIVVFGPCMRA